uniref:Phytanoyl-CoA dioxygenase n=1 Tax=Guillardia theta TaxID=55529 RepID=A0A7S4NPC3_GUITH|mmetsp:Transcript_26984/g.88242  ORF Transcript_26984/g.88242 Transcript_26984/m.88242 type:complete len:373 (+) Transcript_26984:309-1427(+)
MNEEMCEEMRRRGFCLVPRAASPCLIDLMQRECDALLHVTDLDDRDCVVDMWEALAIDDRHPARLNQAAYRQMRCERMARLRLEQTCSLLDEQQVKDRLHEYLEDAQTIQRFLVSDLAGIASSALHALTNRGDKRMKRSEERNSRSAPAPPLSSCSIRLFNEQYVVKPPQSRVEFGWHTDEAEQLQMCLQRPQSPYVSVWLPLCDTTFHNGTLEILPLGDACYLNPPPGVDKHHPFFLSVSSSFSGSPRTDDISRKSSEEGDREQTASEASGSKREQASSCPIGSVLSVEAGTAVVFASDVWHRSSFNESDKFRPVFYAQYSLGCLLSDGSLAIDEAHIKSSGPLAFGVPCDMVKCGRCSAKALRGEGQEKP